MKKIVAIVILLTSLGVDIVSAKELLPWQVELVKISISGVHSVKIDDRVLFFEVPSPSDAGANRASEVISRGDKYEDWMKRYGEYEKYCFAMGWDFYWLGIPILDKSGFMYISTKLFVKDSPANRDLPNLPDVTIPGSLGAMYKNPEKGDFSKPEELRANIERTKGIGIALGNVTPSEEMIINGRKWFHYYDGLEFDAPNDIRWLPSEHYLTSGDYYVTGLAPDRYLEVKVEYSYNPYLYPTEDQRPRWMKRAFKYKEQVISSLRITKPEGSKEPDLYEVER